MTTAVTGIDTSTNTAAAADTLAQAFDRAIAAQAALQEVTITRQPQLDASKEKPR